MYTILKKDQLNDTVVRMQVLSPLVANKAKAGQFVILRAKENSERLPLTVAETDKEKGAITIIFQMVGGGTIELGTLQEGESLCDLVGPLGKPTDLTGIKKACVVGGGVGCAIAWPIVRALKKQGAIVHSVIGFREKGLVILEDEFRGFSEEIRVMTDDGSHGEKGLVTTALEDLIVAGNQYDAVFAIGPLPMMKFVSLLTKKYGVKTVVSMNPVMVDGTGMCGGCRLTVGGEMKFACVDGPDFDGHLVDFDEAISRSSMYQPRRQHPRGADCNLLQKEVQ